MAAKQIALKEESRDKILAGVVQLSKAVKTTLGPRGRNVVLAKSWGSPTVTKDGVTVAKEIELPDKYENMGAQMVKEVASKTSDVAGDGTTTATVLAEAIYSQGLKTVASGYSPMEIKRGYRASRPPGRDQPAGAEQGRQEPRGNCPGRHHLRQRRYLHRRHHSRRHGQGRQGRHHHGRRGQGVPIPASTWSRACSSTAAICRRTSSPTRRAWKLFWKTPTC